MESKSCASSKKSIKLTQAGVEHQLVKDRKDFTNKEKRALQETGYLYRDFMIEKGHIMALDKGLIRIAVPGTAFDPSFEPIIAKALPKVASVMQSSL